MPRVGCGLPIRSRMSLPPPHRPVAPLAAYRRGHIDHQRATPIPCAAHNRRGTIHRAHPRRPVSVSPCLHPIRFADHPSALSPPRLSAIGYRLWEKGGCLHRIDYVHASVMRPSRCTRQVQVRAPVPQQATLNHRESLSEQISLQAISSPPGRLILVRHASISRRCKRSESFVKTSTREPWLSSWMR